jgi:replication factor C subunit 2/4
MHTNIPLVDKYRPTKLEEIIFQTDVIKNLKNIVISGKMPHLILYGPSGTGKTSAILALAHELFGPKKVKERIIELNASDDRGINTVRYKIMTFVKSIIGNKDPNYLCPNYKIIILDEADTMTIEAQSALRKMIETYSNITRFCFICNYINQLIEPIVSRCVKFKFSSITSEYIIENLYSITLKEKMNINKDVIHEIANIANGDMRKGIMLLQQLKYMYALNTDITIKDVKNMSNLIPDEYIDYILQECLFNSDNDKHELIKIADHILYEGYALYMLIQQINGKICKHDKISDIQRSYINMKLLDIEKMLIQGANEYIQTLLLLFSLNEISMNLSQYTISNIYF